MPMIFRGISLFCVKPIRSTKWLRNWNGVQKWKLWKCASIVKHWISQLLCRCNVADRGCSSKENRSRILRIEHNDSLRIGIGTGLARAEYDIYWWDAYLICFSKVKSARRCTVRCSAFSLMFGSQIDESTRFHRPWIVQEQFNQSRFSNEGGSPNQHIFCFWEFERISRQWRRATNFFRCDKSAETHQWASQLHESIETRRPSGVRFQLKFFDPSIPDLSGQAYYISVEILEDFNLNEMRN